MGILRRLTSWRMGFALVFMCVTTVGFLRNALTPELEETDTQMRESSNSTFVFRPSKSSKSTRGAIARSNNTGNTKDNNEKVMASAQNSLTAEDVRTKLTEMARERLGAAFQGIQFDDNTLQWIAGSGKVDSILLSLTDLPPEQWGPALSGLKAKDLEGGPENLVGRPRDDNDCPFGICNNT